MRNRIIAGAALAGLALAGCSSTRLHAAPAATHSAVPAATLKLSPAEQRFVNDMRERFANRAGREDATILALGESICASLAVHGQSKTESSVAGPGLDSTNPEDAKNAVAIAAQDLCPYALSTPTSQTSSRPKPSHKPKPHRQTVTYVVTGSSADVTYGPAGSNLQGFVPMKVTARLGNPQFYAITAQLQGGGSVSCAIEVDGKTISTGTATGGYNIATCEIDQNPLTGQWENTNG